MSDNPSRIDFAMIDFHDDFSSDDLFNTQESCEAVNSPLIPIGEEFHQIEEAQYGETSAEYNGDNIGSSNIFQAYSVLLDLTPEEQYASNVNIETGYNDEKIGEGKEHYETRDQVIYEEKDPEMSFTDDQECCKPDEEDSDDPSSLVEEAKGTKEVKKQRGRPSKSKAGTSKQKKEININKENIPPNGTATRRSGRNKSVPFSNGFEYAQILNERRFKLQQETGEFDRVATLEEQRLLKQKVKKEQLEILDAAYELIDLTLKIIEIMENQEQVNEISKLMKKFQKMHVPMDSLTFVPQLLYILKEIHECADYPFKIRKMTEFCYKKFESMFDVPEGRTFESFFIESVRKNADNDEDVAPKSPDSILDRLNGSGLSSLADSTDSGISSIFSD